MMVEVARLGADLYVEYCGLFVLVPDSVGLSGLWAWLCNHAHARPTLYREDLVDQLAQFEIIEVPIP